MGTLVTMWGWRAQMEVHASEGALLDALVLAVRALDPDILVGFEVQQGSLGYLSDRATALARPEPLLRQLSRTPQVPVTTTRARLCPAFPCSFKVYDKTAGITTRSISRACAPVLLCCLLHPGTVLLHLSCTLMRGTC